jgi:hypothetical protein
MKCPGQDMRNWKPEDIYDVKCPGCGMAVEFFKDDIKRRCPKCRRQIPNPKLDLGCLEWCDYAEYCTGQTVEGNKK